MSTTTKKAPAVLQHGEDRNENHLDAGLADKPRSTLEQVYDNADWWWRDCAWRALCWLAADGHPFDAYDLTQLGVPTPDHPNRWGSLFSAASKQGLIEPVGYTGSRRPSRSGGVCRVWRGKKQETDGQAKP